MEYKHWPLPTSPSLLVTPSTCHLWPSYILMPLFMRLPSLFTLLLLVLGLQLHWNFFTSIDHGPHSILPIFPGSQHSSHFIIFIWFIVSFLWDYKLHQEKATSFLLTSVFWNLGHYLSHRTRLVNERIYKHTDLSAHLLHSGTLLDFYIFAFILKI